jgi:hypothetical protein
MDLYKERKARPPERAEVLWGDRELGVTSLDKPGCSEL